MTLGIELWWYKFGLNFLPSTSAAHLSQPLPWSEWWSHHFWQIISFNGSVDEFTLLPWPSSYMLKGNEAIRLTWLKSVDQEIRKEKIPNCLQHARCFTSFYKLICLGSVLNSHFCNSCCHKEYWKISTNNYFNGKTIQQMVNHSGWH